MKKRILAIETSCDETALSLVEAHGNLSAPKFKILKSVVASQIKVHRPFGGVVPNLAKREHLKNLPILFNKLIPKSQKLKAIDMIAVTVGPGLEPALWAGITFAKDLSKKIVIPLVGANHLEGHLYSFLLAKRAKSQKLKAKQLFPAVALIVSGGHTILLEMDSLAKYKKLGETRDDAAGEAFDKVARLLKLPYPGGPEVEKLARKGNPHAIAFPRPMLDQKNYDFSFSGLKTAVLYYLRDKKLFVDSRQFAISHRLKADVAASFEEAVIDVLVKKTMRAARDTKAKSILLSGGVAANRALRNRLQKEAKKLGIQFFVPDFKYNTDNAVMIAVAAYINFLLGKKYRLIARGDMNL